MAYNELFLLYTKVSESYSEKVLAYIENRTEPFEEREIRGKSLEKFIVEARENSKRRSNLIIDHTNTNSQTMCNNSCSTSMSSFSMSSYSNENSTKNQDSSSYYTNTKQSSKHKYTKKKSPKTDNSDYLVIVNENPLQFISLPNMDSSKRAHHLNTTQYSEMFHDKMLSTKYKLATLNYDTSLDEKILRSINCSSSQTNRTFSEYLNDEDVSFNANDTCYFDAKSVSMSKSSNKQDLESSLALTSLFKSNVASLEDYMVIKYI
jgi:hypothetical protein